MLPLTENDLRSSFINASVRERRNLAVPDNFGNLAWDDLDFLAWRDRKYANLGYVIAELDGVAVGILLREADRKPNRRPQCSWCEDVTLPNDVVFFSAKRAGDAGRNGNTVGTLICSAFECPANARRRPQTAYVGFDVEAARRQRIETLLQHVRGFVREVRDGD
ncbi:FBP domain-containing protein [Microbacterium sp. STN6]|uniref:FBP domain-containing protein n=1 Tax=Microbacterium sp. STN6 TaxID=2995588 RepID=UPI002260D612|nr:FBP domain-containing protein [Microbacterium sp. STN6]MCX7521543.1 FBP domain-containing protein [Microbacterium sp. STN6]